MYLNPVPNTRAPPIEHSIHQVVREASLLYCLPDNPFFTVGATDGADTGHAVQEATYAYVGWIFAQHFCNRLGSAYIALKNGTSAARSFITRRLTTSARRGQSFAHGDSQQDQDSLP